MRGLMTNLRFAKTLLLFAGLVLIAPCAIAQSCVDSLKEAVQNYQAAAANTAKAADKYALLQDLVKKHPEFKADTDAANQDYSTAQSETDAASGIIARRLHFKDEFVPCIVAPILANPAYTESSIAKVKAAFQQNGSSSGSGGSTNVVSKGIAAKVLSVASEYGALTESVSNQTVTLSGTLAGIPTVLAKSNVVPFCIEATPTGKCVSAEKLATLSRFSYSVAFPASQNSPQVSASSSGSNPSTQPTTFSAKYQSITAATAKAILIKGASAKPTVIANAIQKLNTGTNPLNNTNVQKALDTLNKDFPDSTFNQWATSELARLKKLDLSGVEQEWNSWGQSLPAALCGSLTATCKLQADAEGYAEAYFDYLTRESAFVEGLRSAPVLSVEYDANLPASQTSNSTIRLIAGIPVAKSGVTITANGAVSFYNGTPSTTVPGARILRDFQLAAETAYTFGSGTPAFLGQSTLSAAYYYQDQTSPSILNVTPGQPVSGVIFTGLPSTATQVFAQRGVINLVQGKFNFIPGKGSINVPLSVTWSNRTELVTQKVWRTQIGISYDFDSLFSGLGK
jgi:hypothetical protein